MDYCSLANLAITSASVASLFMAPSGKKGVQFTRKSPCPTSRLTSHRDPVRTHRCPDNAPSDPLEPTPLVRRLAGLDRDELLAQLLWWAFARRNRQRTKDDES